MDINEWTYWLKLGQQGYFPRIAEEWLASGCDADAFDALEAAGVDGVAAECLDALRRGAPLQTVIDWYECVY